MRINKTINIRLPDTLYDALASYADMHGMSMSMAARVCIIRNLRSEWQEENII